jgi:hypothetical protein
MALKEQVANIYGVGLRNVGSYQVSGIPWVTGSSGFTANKTVKHSFPYVTKSFTVINNGTVDLFLHFHSGSLTFTSDGIGGAQAYTATDPWKTGGHYVTVPSVQGAVTMDVKVKEFYLSNSDGSTAGKYQVFAELTNIPTSRMFHLTGSGISEE